VGRIKRIFEKKEENTRKQRKRRKRRKRRRKKNVRSVSIKGNKHQTGRGQNTHNSNNN